MNVYLRIMSSPPLGGLPPGALNLNNTLGAILIGSMISAVLVGVTSLQTWIFFQRPANHHTPLLRAVVFLLWILDSVHLVFITWTLYSYCVTDYGNPLALTGPNWSILADYATGITTEAIVSGVYIFRLRSLGGHWALTVALTAGMLTYLAAAMVTVGICSRTSGITYIELNHRFGWTWFTTYGAQSFTDATTAISLCITLAKRRTGFRRTDSLIQILMLYLINTCALTSVLSITILIMFAISPNNFVFIALATILPKMMLNSMLALLNSRDTLLKKREGGVVSIHLSALPPMSGANNGMQKPMTNEQTESDTPTLALASGKVYEDTSSSQTA